MNNQLSSNFQQTLFKMDPGSEISTNKKLPIRIDDELLAIK